MPATIRPLFILASKLTLAIALWATSAVAQNTVTNEVTDQEASQLSTDAVSYSDATSQDSSDSISDEATDSGMPDYLEPNEIGTYDKREADATNAQSTDFPEDDNPRASNAVLGVLADDVALTIDGEARLGFHFGENFDADTNSGFSTLNYIGTRASLEPTLYLSEIVQIVTNINLLPNVVWGGQAAWNPQFVEGYIQFTTLAGRFRLGRQLRSFGMGLAWAEGRDNEVPFGFVDFGPAEDRLDWNVRAKVGSMPIRVNTSLGWLEDPYAAGILSRSDRLRYAIGLGASANEIFDIDVLGMYEWQRSDSYSRFDVSLATKLALGKWLEWDVEAGLRHGTTQQYVVYDPLLRTTSTPALDIRGYRAGMRLGLTNVRTRKRRSFRWHGATRNFLNRQQGREPICQW